MNTKEYWEERFRTGDWSKKGGKEQTFFFAKLIVDNLPSEIIEEIEKQCLSICDWGCAEGEGVFLFSRLFKNLEVTGVDISESAIKKAREKYPNCRFKVASDDFGSYDVIISSNTLEHFFRPYEIADNLSLHARRFLIFLLPFQEENRIDEHFYTFDYTNIPFFINNFGLRFFKEINTSKLKDTHWDGKQILLVYEKSLTYQNKVLSSLGIKHLSESIDFLEQEIKRVILEKENALKEAENVRLRNKKLGVELELVLEQKRNVENALKHLISERDTLRKELDDALSEKKRLFDLLNEIYSSRFWKLANKYYRFKEWITGKSEKS